MENKIILMNGIEHDLTDDELVMLRRALLHFDTWLNSLTPGDIRNDEIEAFKRVYDLFVTSLD